MGGAEINFRGAWAPCFTYLYIYVLLTFPYESPYFSDEKVPCLESEINHHMQGVIIIHGDFNARTRDTVINRTSFNCVQLLFLYPNCVLQFYVFYYSPSLVVCHLLATGSKYCITDIIQFIQTSAIQLLHTVSHLYQKCICMAGNW